MTTKKTTSKTTTTTNAATSAVENPTLEARLNSILARLQAAEVLTELFLVGDEDWDDDALTSGIDQLRRGREGLKALMADLPFEVSEARIAKRAVGGAR
jgi:hypothetical protein